MLHRLLHFVFALMPLTLTAQYLSEDYDQPAEPFIILNDGSANFSPTIGDNGTFLWFTRTGHFDNVGGESNQDIWFSQYENRKWSIPSNDFEGLNTDQNDLIVGQSENTTVYVIRYDKKTDDLSTITAMSKIGDKYVNDHDIIIPGLEIQGSFFGFFVARDESYIIISMKGPEGFGKEDLYISLKEGGEWSEPIHMGARINTSGFEMSPFVSRDNRHLFFSSEGHRSFGQGDIFVATRLDDTWQNWSKPINLGPNINTEGFEAYFCMNERLNEAYFFSDRSGDQGEIYSIPFKLDPMIQKMSAHQMANGFIKMGKLPAMNVKLNLLDENDEIIQTISTNDDGSFNLQSFLPDRDYKLAIDEEMREDIGDAEIFLANDLGDKMVFMNEEELGIFAFKVISGDRIDQLNQFEALAEQGKVVDTPTKISGRVTGYGTLEEEVTLEIRNEQNELVETVTTDEEGFFSFDTEASERRYFLSIDKDVTGLVDVYEVFLTNENPEEDIMVSKTDKHLFEFASLNTGEKKGLSLMREVDEGMPEDISQKFGLFEYPKTELAGYLMNGELPVMDAEIALMDENDNMLGTVVTDDSGKFSFDESLIEGDYKLMLQEEQEDVLKNSEIFLAKNPQDVLFYLDDDRNGVFAFKKLTKKDPMTLYSLKNEAESGMVVNEYETTIKGKFQYKALPQKGVMLTLMDEEENIIERTEVSKDGTFEFNNYLGQKSYFISAEGDGLSDIYEIYLSGPNKNVLVNRTDRSVFAFKVLPSEGVVITSSVEKDSEMRDFRPRGIRGLGSGVGDYKRSYLEYDLNELKEHNYLSLRHAAAKVDEGFQVVIRLYVESASEDSSVKLKTIKESDLKPVINYFQKKGIDKDQMEVSMSTSDQAYLIITQE